MKMKVKTEGTSMRVKLKTAARWCVTLLLTVLSVWVLYGQYEYKGYISVSDVLFVLSPLGGFWLTALGIAHPFFRWYDLWTGVYIDRGMRRTYVCFLPMVGVWMYYKMPDWAKYHRYLDRKTPLNWEEQEEFEWLERIAQEMHEREARKLRDWWIEQNGRYATFSADPYLSGQMTVDLKTGRVLDQDGRLLYRGRRTYTLPQALIDEYRYNKTRQGQPV